MSPLMKLLGGFLLAQCKCGSVVGGNMWGSPKYHFQCFEDTVRISHGHLKLQQLGRVIICLYTLLLM